MEINKNLFLVNAAGRKVPEYVNGIRQIPYAGVGVHLPSGQKYGPPVASCVNYPADGNKLLPDLGTALLKAGLRDGVVISTHHHFRNGDLIAQQIFDFAHAMGLKNLVWAPSASFDCHKSLIPYLEDGTIHHIEGSMNGPLGIFTSQGKMQGMGVLRSHGGRYQAIQDGELRIDIAVIAAPAADAFGNATGDRGQAACGLLGFALADSRYATAVVVVTDNLVPFPCVPWQIQGNDVDFVVVQQQIGIAEKIVSGTTEITKSPDRLYIAELTARFCDEAGIVKDGFSFQSGSGGTSLAVTHYLAGIMRRKQVKARFVRGGSTKYLVQMLEEGLTDYILDGQTFDMEGVRSMRENERHVNTSPFTSYNYHGKGNFSSMLDLAILGATEVDLNFNANVATHSDGLLLHGIGGWQNCLFAKCVILPVPLFRDRIPVIKDEVTTLCGPGELIDVVITERGIAINPLRHDLIDSLKNSKLPLRSIQDLKAEADALCGVPEKPCFTDRAVAVVKWVDGSTIDTIWQIGQQ